MESGRKRTSGKVCYKKSLTKNSKRPYRRKKIDVEFRMMTGLKNTNSNS